MRGVIFIPARGGSNGIRNKNILTVGGRPLIEWSVLHAMYLKSLPQCAGFKTVVSTDSDEIFNVAERVDPGVVRSFRTEYSAGSKATQEEVLIEYFDREDSESKAVILLQPTSPIRGKVSLESVAEMARLYDSVVTVREGNPHTFRRVPNGFVRTFDKRWNRQDRPDEERVFFDTGNTYAFSRSSLLQHADRIDGNVGHVGVSLYESLELDDIEELPLIEAAMVALGMVE